MIRGEGLPFIKDETQLRWRIKFLPNISRVEEAHGDNLLSVVELKAQKLRKRGNKRIDHEPTEERNGGEGRSEMQPEDELKGRRIGGLWMTAGDGDEDEGEPQFEDE